MQSRKQKTMSDKLIEKSKKPINKMLELSAKFGL